MGLRDTAWKEIIEEFFPQFIEFFLPDLKEIVDWNRKPISREQELQSIFPESKQGKGIVDKLIEIHTKKEKNPWIFIHIEIQNQKQEQFGKRMFKYFYRILDRYDKKIVAIAILGDRHKDWNPKKYVYDFYKTELIYKYRTYKILDANEEELLNIKNVFVPAILSAKYAILLEKDLDKEKVYNFKINLIRKLYEKKYKKEEIINLFKFIDILLYTPPEMKERLISDIKKIEEVKNMPYLSPTEELIREEGLREGIEKGLREGIEKGLRIAIEIKFGEEGVTLFDKEIKNLPLEKLEILKDNLKRVNSIDELRNLLGLE